MPERRPARNREQRKVPERGLKDWAREFHRSTLGKLTEIISAATAAGAIGYSGMEYVRGEQSHAEAWKQFTQADRRIERISYETLDQVPADQLEHVLRGRDTQYEVRLEEAVTSYRRRTGGEPDSHLVQELQQFHPSQRERAMRELGLGRLVETNVPIPAIRLETPRFNDTAFKPRVGAQVRGRVKPANSVAQPDTIFIKPEEDHVLEVMQHEYSHIGQLRHQSTQERWLGHLQPENLMNPFQEGTAELTRLEVNRHIGFNTKVTRYGGERMAAFTLLETIGAEKFWQLYAHGEYAKIADEFNQRTSPGLFRVLFDTDHGGLAVFERGPLADVSPEQMQALTSAGAFAPERFEAFEARYGMFQPSPDDEIVKLEDGSVGGVVTADSYRFMAGIAIQGKEKIIVNDAPKDSTSVLKQLDSFPAVAEAWKDFRFSEGMNQHERFESIKRALAEVIEIEKASGTEKK